MDFGEVEAIEGLRWPWNAWPSSRSAAAELVVPLSVLYTPLAPIADLHILPYDPLSCSCCGAFLNPYARVDYQSGIWNCPFCSSRCPFPRSYAGLTDHSLPAELFPTHSTVEYLIGTSATPSTPSPEHPRPPGPAFVFVIDLCSLAEELYALKNEVLRVIAQLPENALVGLVSFGEMVLVHDLGFAECSRAVVLCGDRELTLEKIQELMCISTFQHCKSGMSRTIQRQGFLLSVSDCEFNINTTIEDLAPSHNSLPGHRPQRATGTAILTSVALLYGYSPSPGGRVMVFTSGPATIGYGRIVQTDLSMAIRTHRDLINGNTPLSDNACKFYNQLTERLLEKAVVLDLFACSLDQVGAAELRYPVEASGGFMVLAESFESEQFKKTLGKIFKLEKNDNLNMNFDATIAIIATKEVKICGALGPCLSLHRRNINVCEKEIGQGGTNHWKLSTVTDKTCIAFVFQVGNDQNVMSEPVFFIQLATRYHHANGGIHMRVTTAARRWVDRCSQEIAAGFDQESAAVVVARLAVDRAKEYHAREVIRWLDKLLVRFASKFGVYVPEDPSTFRLSSNFSLYPQFIYYFRRSQFIDIFNSTPDETAFFRLMLNREGVFGSLVMIRPTLYKYSFEGPPEPVLLDISSISPDVILLFDSYFLLVIHHGSKIAHRRKLDYTMDPTLQNLRKLLEAPELDADLLVADRIPVPKIIKCDQYASQARFLLARLNPSVTQNSQLIDGSEMIFTDDASLQAFVEHLQALAVQS